MTSAALASPELPGYRLLGPLSAPTLPASGWAWRLPEREPRLITVVPAAGATERTVMQCAALNGVPGVVPVRQVHRVAGHFVLEAATDRQRSLAGALQTGVSLARFAAIGATVLEAIEALHSNGLAHGHVCAELVLLNAEDQPMLAGAATLALDPDRRQADLDAFLRLCLRALAGRGPRGETTDWTGQLQRLSRIDERLGGLAASNDPKVWRDALLELAAQRDDLRVRDAAIEPGELATLRSRIGQRPQFPDPSDADARPARLRWWRVGLLLLLLPVLAGTTLLALRDSPWLPEPLRTLGVSGEFPDASAARVRQLLGRAANAADPLEAVGYYRQVLVFRPEHPEATRRLADLIARMRGELRALISTLEIETAENLLDTWSRSIGPELEADAVRDELTQARTIRGHLRQAQSSFEAGRLLAPPADNVRYHLEAVLEMIPGEPNATQGMARLAQALVDRARGHIEAADERQAVVDLQAARAIFPTHPALAAAEAELAEWRAAVDDAIAAVARIEARSDRPDFDSAALLAAVDALAPLLERNVPAITRAGERAREALRAHANRAFEAALSAGTPASASGWLAALEALAGIGAPAVALDMRTRVDALQQDVAAAARRARLGQQAWAAGALSLPADGSALDHWRAALALDPTQTQARAGLERLQSRARALAERARGLQLADEHDHYARVAESAAAALAGARRTPD